MTEVKVTKKDRFVEIAEIMEQANRTDLADFIQHEIDLLNKKVASQKKKKNDVNDVLDNKIIDILQTSEAPMTASAILTAIGNVEGIDTLTLPRINSRLSYLGKEAKQIDRSKTKKNVLFSIGTGCGFISKEED